ncbi:MAG: retron St85 family effector protein [Bacteroidales bacterium]|nr:retron St85 family effector protein [Bacteroidales bacterium]
MNEISIFLCGGSGPEKEKFRRKVGEKISGMLSKYKYTVYYPEDIFIELILGHQKQDLLTLENLLANSVNAVVVLLQSPGTFTELGAFANYEKLNDKLIVINDPRFTRRKSFINLGPIRYLETKTQSKVVFSSMDSSNLYKLVKQIADSARDVAKHSSPIRDLSNPISAYRFYLALIYIFDPIPKDAILTISRALAISGEKIVVTAAETVINSLINERKVSLSSGNLSTTSKGIDNLIYGNETRKKARMISSFLTKLRLEALNLTLRRNYQRIWGEAKGS